MANGDLDRLEVLRSALESAKETGKACLLINSGAAVALLAFMGHLVTEKVSLGLIPGLLPSLNWFVAGIVTATLAHGFAYITNLFFWRGSEKARNYRILAGLLIIASISSFIGGCYAAYRAFSAMPSGSTKSESTIQSAK